jgi:matrix metalloproteinase-14 (membrane-inserted)
MMIPYVQEISTGSSTTMIPDQGLINNDYLCSGNKYWKFHNQDPDPGFPKDMSVGFPGIPPNIDTAFVWSGNGKIYFTKDNFFWKFDPESRPYVRSEL